MSTGRSRPVQRMKRSFWDGMCLGTVIGTFLGAGIFLGFAKLTAMQAENELAAFMKAINCQQSVSSLSPQNKIRFKQIGTVGDCPPIP